MDATGHLDGCDEVFVIDITGTDGAARRVGLARGFNPFVVCWGVHRTACPLLADAGRPGGYHGLVVEMDFDEPAHRALYRWFRTNVRPTNRIRAVARVPRLPNGSAPDTIEPALTCQEAS